MSRSAPTRAIRFAPAVLARDAASRDTDGPAPAGPGIGGLGRLPPPLRAGLTALSGLDLADVRVHANSPQPHQYGAVAFARGADIHLAPGQERHLPHEAWHIVQQRQGRVPTTGRIGTTRLNDDPRLEAEADAMGRRALDAVPTAPILAPGAGPRREAGQPAGSDVVQRLAFERTTSGMIGGWLGRADTDAEVWVRQYRQVAEIVARIGEQAVGTTLAERAIALKTFVLDYADRTVLSADRVRVGQLIANQLNEALAVERDLPAAVAKRRLAQLHSTLEGVRDDAESLSKDSKLRKEFRRLQQFVDSFDWETDSTELIATELEAAESLQPRVSMAAHERRKQLEANKSKPAPPKPEATGEKTSPSLGKMEETAPKQPVVEPPRPPAPPVWTWPKRPVREDKWWANLPNCNNDNITRIAEGTGNQIGQHTEDHRPDIANAFQQALIGEHVDVSEAELRMLNGNHHLYDPERLPALTLDADNSDALAKVYDYVRKNGTLQPAKYPGTSKRQLRRFPLFDEDGDDRGTFQLARPLVVIVNTLSNDLRKDPGTAYIRA